ncbi:alpha/beta fold hydrolase [Clostridium sp.]|uniref:alpha/beta fold hydrolase n=1 Tax=Clostridium sp. TaxID=1506 RepID=UPI003F335B30
MKLLPHSNGVYKVNMRKKLSNKDIAKRILIFLGILLLIGFLYQRVSNFIAKETLKARVDYTRVDDKRLDYIVKGEGKYTVIFDGNIGGNLNQWSEICDELINEYDDITTFVYNRRGYGFSDGGSVRTPDQQAKDLKILLRKAGISGPYILVGEEYGSLVLTSFAEQFKDIVSGVVLIDPIIASNIKTEEYKSENRIELLRRKIEKIGASIGLTTLLDKLDLDAEIGDFEDNLNENATEEFKVHRTKSNYTSAVYNELKVLRDGSINDQVNGMLSGIPYYLIEKDGQESLEGLGDQELTKIYKTSKQGDFISLTEKDAIITGIRTVVKQANDIEKRKGN